MIATIEISKYPLTEDYIEPIQSFINRLNKNEGLQIKTYATNTLIKGEYDHLMQVMQHEIKRSFEDYGKVIFVMKILHADLEF